MTSFYLKKREKKKSELNPKKLRKGIMKIRVKISDKVNRTAIEKRNKTES